MLAWLLDPSIRQSEENADRGNYLDDPDSKGRDRWPSRAAFILAAVGSAVGFGNVWRFPALAADYGGGAFFIPYLLALFLIGLPTIILEISLGQYYQTGDVGVFGSFHKRMRGVGMTSVAAAYILVSYYSMLLAWVANAFFDSFGSGNPWGKEGTTGEEAVGYFLDNIVGMKTLGPTLSPTRIVWTNVGYSAMTWALIFFCLAFGLKWTGRIAYLTMGIPIILLFVFLGKACTLEGANNGIKAYIGEWDMSVLRERGDVWSEAVSQIFFSLSVTMGTMTAYGSHCPRKEPATLNATIIAFSNSAFSFISGFAVFASLGHLAYISGVNVSEIPYKSFDLVFGTWPVVLGTLPGGIHWTRLLFFDLYLLGIDSAFSILEGPITVCKDYIRFEKTAKWKVVACFAFGAFAISILYATDAGLIFLDTIDFYINFMLLLIGFFETFAAGWMFGLEEQIAALGNKIVFTYMAGQFITIIASSAVWFGLNNDNAVWAGFLTLGMGYLMTYALTFYFAREKLMAEPDKWTWKSISYEIMFRNVMELREGLSKVLGYMNKPWAAMLRHFIPQVLLVLFINLCSQDSSSGEPLFGHYEGYETYPFQFIGIICVGIVAFLFLLGVIWPKVYEGGDRSYWGEIHAMKIYEAEAEIKKLEDSKMLFSSGMEESGSEEGEETGDDKEEVSPVAEQEMDQDVDVKV